MMDGLEHDLLSFVAAHELVTAEQAAALLEITNEHATESLASLCAERSVSRIEMSSRLPTAYRITCDGAQLIDSALSPLRPLSWSRYRHELAIAWLWVTARHGGLGELREVLSRRQMQAADATLRSQSLLQQPGAVFNDKSETNLGLGARQAYADLGLVQADGGWVPLDVLLTPPEPERLRTMVGRLTRDRLMRAQLYLVERDGQIDEAIKATAETLGVLDQVHVQFLGRDGVAGT
jgi:hypothetical protein